MDVSRYPAGPFVLDNHPTRDKRQGWIGAIANLPGELRHAVEGLSDRQLETRYRPGGWTVRQVVHHLSDSHMNAYIRVKLALTEDKPTIKPYDEAAWALVADTALTPVGTSLDLLEALHRRWAILLASMQDADFDRQLVHPERGPVTNDWLLQLYAWHGRHHTTHVTALREREGW